MAAQFTPLPSSESAAVFPGGGATGGDGLQPFIYDQAVPASSIAIVHNLGRAEVDVTALDISGEEVIVGVQALDANTVEITTVPELPFAGKVLII